MKRITKAVFPVTGIGSQCEEQLLAYRFSGIRYDCGFKVGYLQAQVAFGFKQPEFRDGLLTTLAEAARDVHQG